MRSILKALELEVGEVLSLLMASKYSLCSSRAAALTRRITVPSRARLLPRVPASAPRPYFQHPSNPSSLFSTTVAKAILPSVDDKYKTRTVFDLLSLTDRVIVVTGGGRGIGLALTRACVEAGGNVAVLDALPEPHKDFHELKTDFPDSKVEYYNTDVTNLGTLTSTYKKVVEDFGRIDGCITAAGVVLSKPFVDTTWDDAMRIDLVNTQGTFFSAQLAAKQMIAQGTPGSIVMISSITAHHSASLQPVAAYAASKGAVKSLMLALAVELAPHQIRVNSISPGHILTDMLASLGVANPTLVQKFEGDPPLKRMGNRLDLKLPVVHLLSDGGAYTTGSDLLITGGLHLEKAVG